MRVEWIILADAAQVVGEKLYLLGGGWRMVSVAGAFPVQQQLAIAVSYEVPWEETNVRRQSQLEIETADGASLASMTIDFEVGRPAGQPVGSQRVQVAATVGLQLPAAGTYAVIVRVEGQEPASTEFHVLAPNAGRLLPPIS